MSVTPGSIETMKNTTSRPPRYQEVTVPAGIYYLGDPCYVVPDDSWEMLLVSSGWFETSPIGTVLGYQVLAFLTKYGDGAYEANYGAGVYGEVSVDSGLIGLTPEALVSGKYLREQLNEMGRFVEFADETSVAVDDGLMRFGHIRIDTRE